MASTFHSAQITQDASSHGALNTQPKSTPPKHQEQDKNQPEISPNDSKMLSLSFDCKTIINMGLYIA